MRMVMIKTVMLVMEMPMKMTATGMMTQFAVKHVIMKITIDGSECDDDVDDTAPDPQSVEITAGAAVAIENERR